MQKNKNQNTKNIQKISRSAFAFGVCGLTALSSLGFYQASQANIIDYTPKTSQVLGIVSGKEGYNLRFSDTTNGGLIFTGNSLCLAETVEYGSCGTYITTDLSKSDSDFSPKISGTTQNWQENSSSTKVNIPAKSEILYAELIWGGNYKYLDLDMTNVLDNPVSLTTPDGTFSVTPDSETAAEITTNGSYVRTSNITDIVKNSGSGTYTLASVPSVMVKSNPYNNYVGYTLAIAYKNDSEPARSMSIFVGAEQVGADQSTNTAEVTGFQTPPSGTVDGKLFVSAQEGDNVYSGDKMKFGRDKNNLVTLSGPNNLKDNFFASQINGEDGKLDTNGTFGDKNQPNPGQSISGKRHGWDVTSVNVSSQLTNNQQTAFAQGSSTGDSYVINALGMQIKVNSANVEATAKIIGDPYVCELDESEIEIKIKNNGTATSTKTEIYDLIPKGTTLIEDSLKLDGNSIANTTKINIGEIKPNQTKTLKFKVKINEDQTEAELNNQAKIDFEYNMTQDKVITNTVSTSEYKLIMDPFCGVNRPPEALNDNADTFFRSDIVIDVLVNDSDPEDKLDNSSLEIINQPAHGEAIIENGKIKYTPNPDTKADQDSLKYKICDQEGLCDEAVVTINILPIYPPVAENDQKITKKNTEIIIDVKNNDSDPDNTNEELKITEVSQTKNGGIAEIIEGKILYTPPTDYIGDDEFDYTLCDMDGQCDSAKVSITIEEDKENIDLIPPIASEDKKETPKNTPVTIPVLENDIDQDGTIQKESIKIEKPPVFGGLDIKNGEIIYTPNKDYVGKDDFEYSICDNDGLCDQTKVNITVIETQNDPAPIEPDPNEEPTAEADVVAVDDQGETKINTPISLTIIENDLVDSPESIKIVTNPKNGTVTIGENMQAVYIPNQDFIGTDTFVYNICNSQACDIATATITVKPNGIILGDVEIATPELVRTGGIATGVISLSALAGLVSIYFASRGKDEEKNLG